MAGCMISFLVISESSEKINTWIKDTTSAYDVDRFDLTVFEKDEAEKNTIGIDQVRLMQKKLFLKPMRGKTKALVINHAQTLTIEAQNALLKVLEEPPQDTIIILTTKKVDALIPTIISRCTVVDLGYEIPTLTPEEENEYTQIITSLQTWGLGDRLKKAEVLTKDKQEAIIFLEKMILTGRELLLQKVQANVDSNTQHKQRIAQLFHCLLAAKDAHKILSTTNVNPRLTIENMFLTLKVVSPQV